MIKFDEINCFSKLFILFGLQYFFDKDLKSDSRKDFKSFFAAYFTVLVLLVLGLLLFVISPEFTNEADDDRSLRNVIDRIRNIFMECALVLTLLLGLVESFVKTESVKKLIEKVVSISTMFNLELGHSLDYKLFRKTWMRNFFLFFSTLTFSYVTWVIATIVNGDSFSTLLFGLLPFVFFSLLIFKFIFYVGLVNFQLENLSLVSAPAAIRKSRQEASANVELRKILALRRIYSSIYDCGQYANHIMTVSSLCTLVVLVILLTSTIFRSFIVIIGDLPLSAFFSELQDFLCYLDLITFSSDLRSAVRLCECCNYADFDYFPLPETAKLCEFMPLRDRVQIVLFRSQKSKSS